MSIFHSGRDRSFALKSPKASTWPVHLAALCVGGVYETAKVDYLPAGGQDHARGRLTEWQGCCWRRDGERHNGSVWAGNTSAASWWDWIRSMAAARGTIWIWGWRMWPAWCLLDGMREISEGRLILDLAPPNDDKAIPGRRPRRSSGLFVAEDPPTIICLAVPGGGRIKMIDLANYGIEPEDYDITDGSGQLAAAVQAVRDYHRLTTIYDMGSCQTTAASQAWYCYRRSHLTHPVIVHPMEKVLAMEQAGYYGGRCECLRIGRFRERLYHLDVNSMYTSMAVCLNFPSRYIATWQREGDDLTPTITEKYLMIADVTIKTDEPLYPAREHVLEHPLDPPMRRGGRERIIYPEGIYRTVLSHMELAIAHARGHILEWHRVQYYEPQPLMKSWASWALDMRETLGAHGLLRLRRCAKKVMNSLPGKWGQRMKTWLPFGPPADLAGKELDPGDWHQEWGRHPVNGELTAYRTIAGLTQYQDREQLCSTSCPAIAAAWTSAGRAFLLGGVLQCSPQNVYYYDTDSMIVNETGYQRMMQAGLVSQVKPGLWKLKEHSDDVEIQGIRRYRFGPRWCVAGPFGGEVQGEGEPATWTEHDTFGHQLHHRSVGDPIEIKRRARWRAKYHHGIVDDQGRVHPFVLGQAGHLPGEAVQ